MKLSQIINALPSLQKIAGQELPMNKLYKVSKLLGNLSEEVAFYNAQKEKLLSAHCDIVGDRYVPRKGEEKQLEDKMNELLQTEIEHEVKEVSLGVDDDIKLSYNDLVALKGFISIEDK